MKKYYKFIIAILIIISVVISYFFIPISAEEVFPDLRDMEKIYVSMARGEDGETKLYENIPIEDSKLLTRFSEIIGDVKYRRVTRRDIINPYQFYSFTIIYNDKTGVLNNYSFDINENDYLTVYVNGRKQYKIHNNDGKKVFKKLKLLVLDSRIPIKVEDEKSTTAVNRHDEFTYLEDLPNDKLEKYNGFLKDGDVNHLIEFTPEQIVLIFMNLIYDHNVERLYALLYDNGKLPSLEQFKDEYHYYSSIFDDEYLKYRFYDSISAVEETKKPEEMAVKINMVYGSTTHSVAYGLRKEKNVWKMDFYHLVEKFNKRK